MDFYDIKKQIDKFSAYPGDVTVNEVLLYLEDLVEEFRQMSVELAEKERRISELEETIAEMGEQFDN